MNQSNFDGIKIVWVEDDKFLVSLIQKRMAGTTAQLVQVTDGALAVDKVKEIKPHVVVLDLLMPNMDGFQILKALKTEEETKDIPVLVLSNLGQEEEIKKAHDLGATKFVVKATIGLDGILPEIEKIAKGIN